MSTPCSSLPVIAMMAGCVALTLPSCEQTPGEYDYHGRKPDIPSLDTHGRTDIAKPDISIPDDGTGGRADADLPNGKDKTSRMDIAGPDFPADLVVPVENSRECTWSLSFEPPDQTAVFLAGEFTGWAAGEIPLSDDDGDGAWELELDLAPYEPGNYAYKFHTSGDNWYSDPGNPMSKWSDGIENSKLVVPDCRVPLLRLADWEVEAGAEGLEVTVDVLNYEASDGVRPATAALYVNGKKHNEKNFFDPEKGRFDVKLTGLNPGSKVSLRFAIENEFGPAQDLLFPVWLSNDGWTWRDAALYFAFTDRFHNGNQDNDGPADCLSASSPTNWHGGDFAGIREKVEEGYFTALGIDVLWISPVIDNPNGCMSGTIEGVTYTAYHGYFPVDLEAAEENFGSIEELRELVDIAHQHGIRVIIDFVANHVHEDSSLWQDYGLDGWFHDFYPCEPNWDKPIECWFQPYLPDLDYTNDEVVETLTDNAVYWIYETGVDGFRVDAVKHMVHNFMRTLRWKIEQRVATAAIPFYMVGETFMGEWGGGTGEAETVIKEYVNDWELNGQFDFPFYWKIVKAVGRDEGDFVEFAGFLSESAGYWGENALMVSFIGNHDVPRFLSHAGGQIEDLWGNGSKTQGLYDPPEQPAGPEAYDRSKLAIGLLFTLPEIPMLYYGDETGLAGAGDPDNRRDMKFENLSEHQAAILQFARKIGVIRRQLVPLRRGDFDVAKADADILVFTRTAGEERVVVAANRSKTGANIDVALPGLEGELTDLISGGTVPVSGGKADIWVPPLGLSILVAK